EMAIFEVAAALLPPAVTGILMAAIMAAIMSTADSLLLQTGSIAARDLYQRFFKPAATERQMVWVSRLLVLAIGLVGYAVAVIEPPTVFGIVVFATSVLGSAFLPSYLCAVWWRRANAPGALASMVTGAGVAFLWQLAALQEPSGLHPMLAGLLSSSAAMVLVSLATQRSSPVPQEILDQMTEASRLHSASPA
ncbi:MAG: sodium/proline symporter, partial [bacterium]|nr:sodium/proline symporter [bacterium]